MSPSREVLIALAAGGRLTVATGFDCAGRALAQVRIPHATGDDLEHDPLAAWQAARSAIRGLADRIPDLARRAVGLAITGTEGGIVAVDEDGDPLAVAVAPGAWPYAGPGPGLRDSGTRPTGPLAWLAGHHPEITERAALLLPAKDWIHFCLTGAAAVEPIGADLGLGPPGSREASGLEGLLPGALEVPSEPAGIARAAAGACRLRQGLPALLAPPAGVSAAIAQGALDAGPEVGFALLEDVACYLVRPPAGPPASPAGAGTTIDLPFAAGPARVVAGAPAGDRLAWLTGLLQDVLGEIGLIGTGQDELHALLRRRAGLADPAELSFAAGGATGRLDGLGRTTSIGDLARAALEEVGQAARRILTDLGGPPAELRATGGYVADPLARALLAAAIGQPLRLCRRDEAATAGAALLAARTLGITGSGEAAGRDWVAPYLAEPERPDAGLAATYAHAFAALPAAS